MPAVSQLLRNVMPPVRCDPKRFRAIVSLTENVFGTELRRIHEQGGRGIRANLVDRGGMPSTPL
jgi:hypothetical protein